jgi:hypothetical protein
MISRIYLLFSIILHCQNELKYHCLAIIIFDTYLKSEGVVVIRVSKVSIVEEPHVSDISDLVVFSAEELGKVLCWFEDISQPDQSWEIWASSLQELASQLNLISFLLVLSLYIVKVINI